MSAAEGQDLAKKTVTTLRYMKTRNVTQKLKTELFPITQ